MDPADMHATLESIAAEIARERSGSRKSLLDILRSPVSRGQLHVGVVLQMLQQLAGINTVMYFTPVILQMAGFADTRQALLFACAPAAVNALGTIAGARFVLLSVPGQLQHHACVHS
jgi:MFS transporter, SP family, solute carrier family 2 (myo-inositol transporter), member 13